MAFLSSLNIAGSALTAQRYRMDVISQNIANAETTRTEEGGPYTRKVVVMQERESFGELLKKGIGNGVEIAAVEEDPADYKLVYDPTHPDADENGYVRFPNVDTVKEMLDMMAASRSYEANVTVVNAIKTMASSALKIGE